MKAQQDIEKEFDEKFGWIGRRYDESVCKYWKDEDRINQVKSFIRQLRQDDIKSLIEWTEKNKKDYLWVGENPETEELEVMDVKDSATWGSDMSFAYNFALSNLISYLQSHLKDEK